MPTETTQLILATTNPGKVNEITAVIHKNNVDIQILTPKDFPELDCNDIDESGTTYDQNAFVKAKFFSQPTQLNTLGEDSGLTVKALQNELGLHTRRWGAGPSATDKEWLDFFMEKMQEFPKKHQREAQFNSHMCLIWNKTPHYFHGITKGHITPTIQADIAAGLPLSSVFIPEGHSQVYSALSEEEKNSISHRGKAIQQVVDFLITQLS